MAKELVKVRLEISPLVPDKGSAKKIVDELIDLMGKTGKSMLGYWGLLEELRIM